MFHLFLIFPAILLMLFDVSYQFASLSIVETCPFICKIASKLTNAKVFKCLAYKNCIPFGFLQVGPNQTQKEQVITVMLQLFCFKA